MKDDKHASDTVIDWDADITSKNPVIDFDVTNTKKEFWYGVELPVRETRYTNAGAIEEESQRSALIRNTNRQLEKLVWADDCRYKLTHKVGGLQQRWSLQDIKAYISGDEDRESNISPKKLYERIHGIYDFYVELDEWMLRTLTNWTIGTYLFPLFDAYPYLHFVAQKGSGKTKTMGIMEQLCFNAFLDSDPTVATLFRMANDKHTMLIDEMEIQKKDEQADMYRILNSGYKRGGKVTRCKQNRDKSYTYVKFDTYCPKAIGNITGIGNDALNSRSIVLPLKRTKTEKGKRNINLSDDFWQKTRDMLYNFGLKQWESIYQNIQKNKNSDATQNLSLSQNQLSKLRNPCIQQGSDSNEEMSNRLAKCAKSFNNRTQELLYALRGIDYCAHLANDDFIYKLAEKIETESRHNDMESRENVLLNVLHKKVKQLDWYSVDEIVNDMREYYSDFGSISWINHKSVGRQIGLMDLSTDKKRVYSKTYYMFSPEAISDMIYRYDVVLDEESKSTLGDDILRMISSSDMRSSDLIHKFGEEVINILESMKSRGIVFNPRPDTWRRV